MTYDIIITDSHVVLNNMIVNKNIIINDGKIISLTNDNPQCDLKIDGNGLVSIPGIIDTHTHYGVYSPLKKSAVTESRVAAIGGVTTMMRILRTVNSYRNFLNPQLSTSSNSHYIDYTFHASILTEQHIDEMKYCVEKGITSFKLYMNLGMDIGTINMDMDIGKNFLHEYKVETNEKIIEDVIKNASILGCPVLVHAEDYKLCSSGMKNAKKKNQDGLVTWSKSRSQDSEVKAIADVSKTARKFGCVLYFVHIGSILAMKQIIKEKKKGTKIYVETCPHYLTLSCEEQYGYLAKVMPPIRSSKDINHIWNYVINKQIDAIGTDHVANRLDMKLGDTIWDTLPGFPGLGTYLPILLSEGINKNRISLTQLVNITSINAAKIFGMYPEKGSLKKNTDADITIFNLKKEIKVTADIFGGYSDYSIYEGKKLKGWPIKTLVRGKLIYDNFDVVGKHRYGKMIERHTTKHQNFH